MGGMVEVRAWVSAQDIFGHGNRRDSRVLHSYTCQGVIVTSTVLNARVRSTIKATQGVFRKPLELSMDDGQG